MSVGKEILPYSSIGQIQRGGLQPRNDSRPRFPCRIVRGGESPQGIAGKDYARTKRKNDGVRVGCFGWKEKTPMDGVTVGLSTGQSVGRLVIRSYSHTNGKGSIFQPQEKRSNHSRLQRQSKHGALRRLQGQAVTPFPDKSSSRFAASVFLGKTLYPTTPCKRAFENGNDRPATHRRKKIIRSIGLERTEGRQTHFGTFGTVGKAGTAGADSRHEA